MSDKNMKPFTQWTGKDVVELLKTIDKKTWSVYGGIGAGVLIFCFLIAWPAWFERPALKMKLQNAEGQIATVKAYQAKKEEWVMTKKAAQEFVASAKRRLFQPGEVSLLLGLISKLAHESNVNIVASHPVDFKKEFPEPFNAQYEASLYEFTVEGNYHELGRFIDRIENHEKLLRVEKFDLKPGADDSARHRADINITAVAVKEMIS